MKNSLKNYFVERNEVYVGELIRPSSPLHKYSEGYKDFITHEDKSGKLDTFSYFPLRSILFTPDEYMLAFDLLYNSPYYPILNMSSDQECVRSNIVIKNPINLGELLAYLEFKENLTFEDIVKLRNLVFSGRFGMDNCELFGYKETMPEDYKYYVGGVQVTDPKMLKKLIAKERRSQLEGHRSFSSNGSIEAILPSEMMSQIDSLGDNSLYDLFMGFDNKIDSFKPSKIEGPVKKLGRF